MWYTLARLSPSLPWPGPAMHLSILSLPILLSLRLVSCHQSIWHPSMFGLNRSNAETPDGSDARRPQDPLVDMLFGDWWFHGHLGYPPHPEDVFEFSAGQNATMEISCEISGTSMCNSSFSKYGCHIDPVDPDNPCPGSTPTQYHTKGLSDVKGCALGIAYKDNVDDIQPEDFAIFSVNQTCVWRRFTTFGVPEKMPPCPNNKCYCAWFWIHSPDSGTEQMYMVGFQCRITNVTSNTPVATSKVARRCGADPDNGKPDAVPGNCTYGAKQPLYWLQAERNNMHEHWNVCPFYNDLYNFLDGPQSDIFDGYYKSMPTPGPDQTELPIVNNSSDNSLPSPSSSVNATSPSVMPSSSPDASNSSATPTMSASTAPVNSVSPCAGPSSSPTSQCSNPSKRSDSAFSRRQVSPRQGIKSFTHRKLGRHH